MSGESNQPANAGSSDQHIMLHDGQWALIPEGAQQPIRVFDSREDALDWAGRSMNHQDANLVIHNEDGTINDTIQPHA